MTQQPVLDFTAPLIPRDEQKEHEENSFSRMEPPSLLGTFVLPRRRMFVRDSTR